MTDNEYTSMISLAEVMLFLLLIGILFTIRERNGR